MTSARWERCAPCENWNESGSTGIVGHDLSPAQRVLAEIKDVVAL